jgi:hypothetical protein
MPGHAGRPPGRVERWDSGGDREDTCSRKPAKQSPDGMWRSFGKAVNAYCAARHRRQDK